MFYKFINRKDICYNINLLWKVYFKYLMKQLRSINSMFFISQIKNSQEYILIPPILSDIAFF